jgi:hypothetical protein|tara:strand:+ start:333 stop:530 length:198 start_codon:yes stop_codon:yes gene_type:complete
MEDFRKRALNDRPAALEAKYDTDDPEQARELGLPAEADVFLKSFTKNLKDKSMGESMRGSSGGYM